MHNKISLCRFYLDFYMCVCVCVYICHLACSNKMLFTCLPFLCFACCQLKTERTEALMKAAEEAAAAVRRPVRKSAKVGSKPKVFKLGVGKYINPHLQ